MTLSRGVGKMTGSGAMGIPGDSLRELMRQWATGVTIVTAQDGSGPHGMTVSSFTSVSLDPPLILVSLEQATRTHKMVLEARRFAVVILGVHQQALAERFAGGIPDGLPRFEGLEYDLSPGGSPIPRAALAYLDCRVTEAHPAGTHTIVVGEVTEGHLAAGEPPLLYYDRGYRRLAE